MNCWVAEHDQFYEGHIIVWGGINYDGSTYIYIIRNGSVTGIKFVKKF